MRRYLALCSALALVAVLAVPSLGAAANGRSVVHVPGAAGWVPTGLYVTGGDELSMRATGFVMTARPPIFFIPGEAISGSGPGGQPQYGYTCAGAGVPPDLDVGPCAYGDAYFGTLIGRVGEVSFVVGDVQLLIIPAGLDGELELTVNDYANTYGDNLGAFSVIFH